MDGRSEVVVQCGPCGGSGVYKGTGKPDGIGFVCIPCGGSGCVVMKYTPFTGRKRKTGIHTVCRQAGASSVTYEEFQEGKLP